MRRSNCRFVFAVLVTAVLLSVHPAVLRAAPFAYVGSFAFSGPVRNGLSVIDTADDSLVTTIDITPAGGLAISPDGSRLYVPDFTQIYVIDAATNTQLPPMISSTTQVVALAMNKQGTRLYGTGLGLSGAVVEVFDPIARAHLASIPAGNGPLQLAVSTVGNRVYVADIADMTLSTIDTATNTVNNTQDLSGREACSASGGIAINGLGNRLYVGVGQCTGDKAYLRVFDVTGAAPLLKQTLRLGNEVSNGAAGVAVNPLGSFVYVADQSLPGSVKVVKTGTRGVPGTGKASVFKTVLLPVVQGGQSIPVDVAVNPTGTKVYVTGVYNQPVSNANVAILDAATNTFAPIPIQLPVPPQGSTFTNGKFIGPFAPQ